MAEIGSWLILIMWHFLQVYVLSFKSLVYLHYATFVPNKLECLTLAINISNLGLYHKTYYGPNLRFP